MEVYPSEAQFRASPASDSLLNGLKRNQNDLGLDGAVLYHNFPLYRDDEGGVLVSDAMLLSPNHGVVGFALCSDTKAEDGWDPCPHVLEQLPAYVHSRLIRNKALRKNAVQLAFDIFPVVFAPFIGEFGGESECDVIANDDQLVDFLTNNRIEAMSDEMFMELVATIDGAKGLIRSKKRGLDPNDEDSKGRQAQLVEAAITNFDQQQKHGIMGLVNGPQRLRGLAGSGKTVVLAMKAAQMHLQFPEAKIAFTFNTKSLYQHVKRLITRFYRQFDDQDPDWDRRLFVLHGWGGVSTPGIYSTACEQHGVRALSFRQAAAQSPGDSFDYACNTLMQSTSIQPVFDFVFVDEGQDFPMSFLRLCHSLAAEGKFVLAYDELQSLFATTSPSTAEIFGEDQNGHALAQFDEDIVLHKCYRNPREIIVIAHALGFGVYGDKIVQILENKDHWEDIGYELVSGELKPGEVVELSRPEKHSLTVISDCSGLEEIVKGVAFDEWDEEIEFVVNGIKEDIEDGLRPEDVLVISVDDRSAKKYLRDVERGLKAHGIKCNNLTADSFGVQDFAKAKRVTLSTVYKAKGNEAFMVYVMGVDQVMSGVNVRKRNMLFTAMTRAKGWVRISGMRKGAKRFCKELKIAKEKFPKIVFTYPSEEELKVMKRDLAESADRKLKARRLLDELRDELSDEEIAKLMEEETKSAKKAKKPRGGKKQ